MLFERFMKDYTELFKEVLMIMMSIKEVYNVIDILCLNPRSSPDNICLTYSFSCHVFQVIFEDRFCDKIDGVELFKFYCNDLTVNSYLLTMVVLDMYW